MTGSYTISGNNGAGSGGGVDTGLGSATLANSTVSGNTAAKDGGRNRVELC